jgi:adenosylmethionine-8-amino-7-oxononanoate aminotransferase
MTSLPERDAKVVWHPYTQHGCEGLPLPVVGAEGAWLQLADGRRVFDGISSWWATLHGHGHPRLLAAMTAQARRLDHVLFAGATHEPAVALAEELLAVAPAGLARVFFSDDGSTAVEVALKMVLHGWQQRGEPQRRVFVALHGAYHGDTFGAMAVGDREPFFTAYAPWLFDVARVTTAPGALPALLASLGDSAAGVIVEPLLQGAAGMRLVPERFLHEARTACSAAGIPLVADEVMTGFGRTGAMFACERAGIAPDLLCLAKGLTGGLLPLAATLTTHAVFEAFVHAERSRFLPHGHTFTANPIACAVARESLAMCREHGVPARLAAIGTALHAAVADLRSHPNVLDLRHLGGMVAFELRSERVGYGSDLALRLRAESLQRGVLLRPLGNVLYALPPACTTAAEIGLLAEVLRALVELAG